MHRRLSGFNAQALSNLAWAFAVFNPLSADDVFGTTVFSTRCAHFETAFSRSDLSQLHQWSNWRVERGAQWPGLPESLRQACHEVFVSREARPSQLQRDVVREIRSHDVHVKEEHRCKVSGYSIDALVTMNDGCLLYTSDAADE